MDEPAVTGVITPVLASIVAIPVDPDVHAPEPPSDENVVVPLEQIPCVPLNVPAFGAVVTVTVHVPVDTVGVVLHVPSFAYLLYEVVLVKPAGGV